MSLLVLFTIGVILIATPLSVLATAFCWRLYREDPGNKLSLVLAVVITATTIAGLLLAIPTVLFVVDAPLELRRASGDFVLLAIDILLPAPVLIAAYLRWLRGRTA